MKKIWEIIHTYSLSNSKLQVNDVIDILLKNRGITTKRQKDKFFHGTLEEVTTKSVGIDAKQLKSALKRIKKAIDEKEQIVVFGDYDVDGICGTAILWETLYSLGAKVVPYIPHRMDEGYGLSIRGIENIKYQKSKIKNNIENCSLIITVDNGIVAYAAVEFAKKEGIDVIITDHHVPSGKLPKAHAIVHTTKLCGTGVAYLLSSVILNLFQDLKKIPKQVRHDIYKENHLELVAMATVADLVPLQGANRTLLIYGLEKLRKTKRVGLIQLFKEADIDSGKIGVYEIGHVIAPRLNAMGRLEYAMDSLRLLCTKSSEKAKILAALLSETNRERQLLTQESASHAITHVRNLGIENNKLLFIAHETYQQGVIGLIAGKLVEEFYRPSIVVSIGREFSKASARSVQGFNIIEFIRSASHLLVDAGGHPMAAGFTVETAKLSLLQDTLIAKATELLDEHMLKKTLRIDCQLPLNLVNEELYEALQALAPFGMRNPEPVFMSKNIVIEDIRIIGRDRGHLKLKISHNCHPELDSGSAFKLEMPKQVRHDTAIVFDGIAFGMGERARDFKIGDIVDIVYTIDENVWNGNKNLQLKIKDIKRDL